ncbi:MAG: aminotransferase class III-fold pyridoxal phosphate-dependent enzyme [Planctomycetota bacterium]
MTDSRTAAALAGAAEIADRPASPAFDPPAAAALAEQLFGVTGTVALLSSYIDQNFLIRTEAGEGWVLKIASSGEEEGSVELQTQVVERLAERVPGVGPRLRRTRDGSRAAWAEAPDGRRHRVWMVSYLEGRLLRDAERVGLRTARSLGELLARVDLALADFEHPSLDRELRWDLARGDWTVGRSFELQPVSRRALVERLQLQYLADVRRRLPELPRAVLYNDANDQNLLVDEAEGEARVVALFDFGDVVRSARVFELAVAGAYAVLDSGDPLGVLGELARGYHGVAPLDEVELEALFPALVARLVTSVTVSCLDARLDPDNAYIRSDEERAWRALSTLAGIEPEEACRALREACGRPARADSWLPRATVETLRARHLGPSLSLSYGTPLEIVRGRGTYLFDKSGRAYLDCVNNVCHVGHCHPHVVAAAQRQIAALNTNTRYLHDTAVRYAERLAGMLPDPLEVCFFVNSGSEANELALRLVRAATDRRDMVVVRWGYHGHTSALIDLSSYKHEGPGGEGAPDWVHVAPCPDPYRADQDAEGVGEAFARAASQGRPAAAFLAEPLIGCGGQIVPPDGWLRDAYRRAREAGALCIADEVQIGFGRVGTHWWAFEQQGAVPDVVTLGKPIGNGHPLAAVVTTREIADAFANGMEFFSTFGGNPVSCEVGMAVLDVLEREDLSARAGATGEQLLAGFRALAEGDPGIGDVRGRGLYLGVELVRDRSTGEPDAARLAAVIEHCREAGVLLSSDGPEHNVLKVKPPMVFDEADARLLLAVLGRALEEIPASDA